MSGAPEAITGRCACGGVTFSLSEPPVGTRSCWCRDCQYMCSGNASMSVFFRSIALSVMGEIRAHERISDAGNRIRRSFCPTCGTPLFAEAPDEPGFMVVRLGTLDDREPWRPQSTIWTGSAPGWAWFDHDRPHSPGQP